MKYILGIDTTFHTSGIALVDENNHVFLDEKANINFNDQSAEKFFSNHARNVSSLLEPVLKKYLPDFSLISVVNEEGAFHSMPVGAAVAVFLARYFGKEIVGVNHEVAHLYSNWLERKNQDFEFPIVALNLSGAHSNIWKLGGHGDIYQDGKIVWREGGGFAGLGAFFRWVCYYLMRQQMDIGEEGVYLDKLALTGQPKYFQDIEAAVEKRDGFFELTRLTVLLEEEFKKIRRFELSNNFFWNDFSRSLLELLARSLVGVIKSEIKDFKPKEIHLAGGLAANQIIAEKIGEFCQKKEIGFKRPIQDKFCGDNAAMAAVAGYYKQNSLSKEEKGKDKFLAIKPSSWYYKYYSNLINNYK